MRSRKSLFIIVIVGLAIFVISWAIGRPLWQAALFSIGFLLVAAIVSSSGLLIPEGLFGGGLFHRRFPRKPPEASNKEDFIERMDSMLADLSAQPNAKIEDITWMTEYTRVMKDVGELVYEVHESVKSKDRAEELRAFREASKRLPHFIIDLKNIPEPVTPNRQKTMRRQVEGLDLYLQACSDFAKALEASDGELAGEAAMQISKALNLLDIMDKSQLLRGR